MARMQPGGFGITPELAEELFDLGLAVITTGNHAWDKKEILEYFPREPPTPSSGQLSKRGAGLRKCGGRVGGGSKSAFFS